MSVYEGFAKARGVQHRRAGSFPKASGFWKQGQSKTLMRLLE